MSEHNKALRYNSGKNRLDLVPPELIEEVGQVLTFGAEKYAPDNWKLGLKFSNCLASLKRHLTAFEKGEDVDPESGLLHLSHVATNVAFLIWTMKHRPDMDDRYHLKKDELPIGLDIDEVLCDFIGGYTAKFGVETPEFWNFDPKFEQRIASVKNDKEFWLNLKPLIKPNHLNFEPHCYITSRSIPVEWTIEWLNAHGFPHKPVYCVPFNCSKVDVAHRSGIRVFIDDRYENYRDLNQAGICTFLMSQPHNLRYDVGYRRIHDLSKFKL